MKANPEYPKTLQEAVKYFADLDKAHQFFVDARWPDGVVCCPRCGSVNVRFMAKYMRWECREKHPKKQFSVKNETILEDSPMTLDKWAVAFWMEANCKNSISSWELHRALGITQKSAWFMLHRIRLALKRVNPEKLGGLIESDGTYIGGKVKNMHKHKRERRNNWHGGAGKAVIVGVLKRGGEVRAEVVKDNSAKPVQELVHRHVVPGSMLYTDDHRNYRRLNPPFNHRWVNHAVKYVDGLVWTNGMENFWSLFKRCIKGTHIAIEPVHLQSYLDSEIFRFNNRKTKDGERMVRAVSQIGGKRLTYEGLITRQMEGYSDTSDNIAGGGNSKPN